MIGFQEVRFEDGMGGRHGPNQVEHLAKLLKEYQFVFQPAQIQTSKLPNRVEEGLAFFSKYPILHSDYTLLSRLVASSDSTLQIFDAEPPSMIPPRKGERLGEKIQTN